MLPEEWFPSLYINSTETLGDFIWYDEIIKPKPRVNYKKLMRDKRKIKKAQKKIEREHKRRQLEKHVF